MSIPIPYVGVVRVGGVLPIIDSRPFQNLDMRKQLGFMGMVFRGAGYSRYIHSMVVYWLTCRRMQRLVEWGVCTLQDRINVEVASLLHDIGHGPGSHLTDPLVMVEHDERGCEISATLRKEIEACGAQFEVVMAILKRVNPLNVIIFDTPLGTDKLAYLWIDSEVTGLGGMPPRAAFLDSVYYRVVEGKGMLVVDPKVGNHAKKLISHYILMYADGYYKKATAVYERGWQQNIAKLLGMDGSVAEFGVDELVRLSDDGLVERMLNTSNVAVRRATERLIERSHPRSAVVMVAGSTEGFFAPDDKPMVCRKVPEVYFEDRRIAKPAFLAELERELGAQFRLQEGELVITPPLLKRRFLPPNMYMSTNSGAMHIKDYWNSQYRTWEEEASDYLRFHFCVVPERRDEIAAKGDLVVERFQETVSLLLA
ncbi:hypothetical protein BH11PAT4_BH11PAT4_6280 [soil metagenome]